LTAEKSTTDQIHVIKQLTERRHEFDKDEYLLFVEFEQEYEPRKRYAMERDGQTWSTIQAHQNGEIMYARFKVQN